MWRRYSIWLFLIAVLVIPVTVYAIFTWYQLMYQRLPVYGENILKTEHFKMKNQSGTIITHKNWEGKIVVVDFFFTHCPTICSKMTSNLRTVQENYLTDPLITINSFSVDPGRDSVERLATYASRFKIDDKNWNLLTGDKKEIYRLARKSFMVIVTDGDGGPDDFIHSDKLVLVDTKNRIRGFYNGTSTEEVAQLVKDIRKLKKELHI